MFVSYQSEQSDQQTEMNKESEETPVDDVESEITNFVRPRVQPARI